MTGTQRTGLAVLAALLLPACSVTGPSPSTSPDTSTTPPPTPPPAATASPDSSAPRSRPTPDPSAATPAPPTPTGRMPLAIVMHATESAYDISLAEAREAAAGRKPALAVGAGQPRILTGRDGTSAEILRRVKREPNTVAVVPAEAVDPGVRVLTVDGRHPLREPDRYPLSVASRTAVPEVTTLSAVGDIMLARRVGDRIEAASDWAYPFRRIDERLASAEITVGNLESTLSQDGSPTQGTDSFGADRRVTQGLELAGFDLVSLANNHVGDYGQRALRQTLDRLSAADLAYVGAGRNLNEARRPVILERDGVRIGFIATDSIGETPSATADRAGTNRLDMPPRTGPLDRSQLARISRDIAALERRADTVIVMTHWGTQYTHAAEQSQRVAARAFAAAGADLVIGGHPHWVQGWEKFGDTVVVHSLGNFVFDMDFQVNTRRGVFLEVVLWDGEVKAVEPVPIAISDGFRPYVVGGADADRTLDDVWSNSRGPFARR